MASDAENQRDGRYWQLLVTLGVLWLLLAAALVVYRQVVPASVDITWETATEEGTAGFSLYRSQERNGEYELVNEDNIISSRGSPVSGATYSFTDRDVEAGGTYFYMLEEIENDGSRRRFEDDLFEYRVPHLGTWFNILILFCVLMGAAMLSSGTKEARKK